jgi:tRNA-specific 2-thiouridylase
VFYDAPSGQARVLGGGFIQSAAAKSAAAKGETIAPQPFVEAMRG